VVQGTVEPPTIGKMKQRASRPKPAITEAIDSAVAHAVTTPLRQRGYRKLRHHWWRDTDGARQAVTVQSSMFNSGASGAFTVEFGFSYLSIGEPRPTAAGAWHCRHRVRIGQLLSPPHDLWWRYEDAADPGERSRNEFALAQTWNKYGLPFLDRMDEPVAYLDHLLSDPAERPATTEALELAEAVGDRSRLDRALDVWLAILRTDRLVPEDPKLNPHPLGWLAVRYAELLPHLDSAGRSLAGADLIRARDAVRETIRALAEGHQWELYMHHDRAGLLVSLGDVVGVDARAVSGDKT
jgi:hypothetical protein